MTLTMPPDLAEKLGRVQEQLQQGSRDAIAARNRWQTLEAATGELADRLTAIDSEVRQLRENGARRCVGTPDAAETVAGEVAEAIERLLNTRQLLEVKLPIRLRAAELAKFEYVAADQSLNELRAQQTRVMQAAGRRVIR